MKKVTITSALLIFLFLTLGSAYGQVIPTNEWIRLYGQNNYLNGNPLPVGAVVDAYDPDGVNCGRFIVDTEGEYGVMPVYRDDIYTDDVDEGAELNDPITVYINGLPASMNGPDTPVWSRIGEPFNVEVSSTQTLAVDVNDPVGLFTSPSQTVTFNFQVENTGNGIDRFDLNATSQLGWGTQILDPDDTDYLDPGETYSFQVRVNVPADIFTSTIDSIFVTATSIMDGSITDVGKTIVTVIVTSVDDDNSSVIPDQFALGQNYPNPFNPETVISYSLKKSGNVRLEIYNLLGQSVDLLIDEYQDAGEYSVVWNAASGEYHPSGVYFYRLTVGDYTLTRKMVLMK